MKKFILEIIVFISGGVVMILELVGSRILAPYVGTSIFVWTSLIGIILGSLSLGYHLGGKISDKNASFKIFSLIIFTSSLLIALTIISKSAILELIQTTISDIRISSTLSALILFAPASIFLGMISPYAVRLKIKNIKTSGQTVGNLYAISTIGSIVGTFLAGFFLISYFGSTKLLLTLSITLALTAILAASKNFKLKASILITTLLISTFLYSYINTSEASSNIIDIDTPYSHIQIYESTYNNLPIKVLKIGNDYHSGISLENDELAFEYTKFYYLAQHFKPEINNSLMIGGGAFTFPQDFIKTYPEAQMDVVEIDPYLKDIATKYFNLEENTQLNIIHEDGRTFLNKNENKYDVIFIDAFQSSHSIPYQLTTMETVEKINKSLVDDGIVLINIISAIEGDKGKFLRAEYLTYKQVFPQVLLFPVQFPSNGDIAQNIILIGQKTSKAPGLTSNNETINGYLKHYWNKEIPEDMPVLTDEHAPVDQYIMEMI